MRTSLQWVRKGRTLFRRAAEAALRESRVTAAAGLPDAAHHASLQRRMPKPGDLITCHLPGHDVQKDGAVTNLVLLLYCRNDYYHGLPTYTVTPVMPETPKRVARNLQRSFFARVQGLIFPLDRKGNETINTSLVFEIPVVPQHFPDLHGEHPRRRRDVLLNVRGSVSPDWLAIVRDRLPGEEHWNRSLLQHISRNTAIEEPSIEDQFAKVRERGGMGLYNLQGAKPGSDPQ